MSGTVTAEQIAELRARNQVVGHGSARLHELITAALDELVHLREMYMCVWCTDTRVENEQLASALAREKAKVTRLAGDGPRQYEKGATEATAALRDELDLRNQLGYERALVARYRQELHDDASKHTELAAALAVAKARGGGAEAELARVARQLGVVKTPDADLADAARSIAGHMLNFHARADKAEAELVALRAVRDAAAVVAHGLNGGRIKADAADVLLAALAACPSPPQWAGEGG